MKFKHIILTLFIALFFIACDTGTTNGDTASSATVEDVTTDGNSTVDVIDSNITVDVNGSLTINFAGAISSKELTTNNELISIEVLIFGSDNAPYTGGTIFVAYPEKATTGVNVGSFSSLSADVVDGKAVFNYTGPKDLQALVDNNDTSTVFGFYHSSDATTVQDFTFVYNPVADQIVLETYSVNSSLSDNDITLGLESSKLVSFYVEDDTNKRLEDSKVHSITVEVLNTALVELRDTLGNSGDVLTFNGENDVSMSIESNTISGLVPIKITASFLNINDENVTITDVFNVVVLSGPATAMSISYAGTSNDSDNAKFKEKMIIAITDEYGNKVNTNPGFAVELMSGYAKDTSGPLDYMYHKSIGTLEDTKFSVESGTIANIEMTNSGSNYSVAPTVSYAGGDGTFQGTAVLSTRGSITDVVLLDSGKGYVTEPTVSAEGIGSGFTGKVNLLSSGSFSDLILDNPGGGYDSAPSITPIAAGTGFEAEAILQSTGTVKSVSIDNPGTGYAVGDELSVLGDGNEALIKVTGVTGVNSDEINEITIFNKGADYSYATIDATAIGNGDARFTVSIGYELASVRLVEGGDGYANAGISVTGGSPEVAASVFGVLSYGVDSVTVLSGGDGYRNPDIVFEGNATQPTAYAVVKYGVNYVSVDNAGTLYSDGSLTFTSSDAGSGAAANVAIYKGFANADEDNYKLAIFGNGYVYNASGKWDFTHVNAADDNEIVLIDSYDGNKTTDLGFAIGNNYRQDPCIFGKEWIAKVDTIANPIFDTNGLAELEISYDYYLVAKDIVIMANLVGTQNSLGETIRLGEATKHTLRGAGIVAPVISFPKGVSNGIYTFYITLDDTIEPLRNANFTYSLEVTGKDVSAYVLSTSNISECGKDSDGNVLEGRAYVSVVVSSPTEEGTISLADLLIVKEFEN